MPNDRTEKLKAGDDNYEIVRVESYIDEEGEIRKGVCYSKSASDLEVWFREEDFKESHPFWEIPKIPDFFNGKVWKSDVPYWNTSKGKTIKKGRGKNFQQNQQMNYQMNPGQQQNPGYQQGQYSQQSHNQYPPPNTGPYPQIQQQSGGQSGGHYPQHYHQYQHNENQYPRGQSYRDMQGQQFTDHRPREPYFGDNYAGSQDMDNQYPRGQ